MEHRFFWSFLCDLSAQSKPSEIKFQMQKIYGTGGGEQCSCKNKKKVDFTLKLYFHNSVEDKLAFWSSLK